MSKNVILALAIAFAVLWGVGDSFLWHGHWSDARLVTDARSEIDALDFMKGNLPIDISSNYHRVVLSGKVDSETQRQEISYRIAHMAGVRAVENNIQVLDAMAVARLEELLSSVPDPNDPSRKLPFNYVIKEHGHVVLTGPVADPAIKERVEAMIMAIPGVQSVENHLGENLGGLLEARLAEIMRLHNIYFDFNKYTIRDDSKMALDLITKAIKSYPNVKLRIEGHTDAIASQKYNQWLSEKRAGAVKDALVQRGIDAGSLTTEGFGKLRPVAPNGFPEGRAENRRIEFHVVSEGQAAESQAPVKTESQTKTETKTGTAK